jgi:nanoRNase/pAp phosphatase (c-di-AMP/oligoRNAs hydrolase)
MSETQRYRLVTRSDFDGLVCAALLKQLGIVDDISFVHPKDMQDGKVEIGPRDITANLPYVHGCHLAFDHHASELSRLGAERPANLIIDADSPSAARVVFKHYGGAAAFDGISAEMMDAVDKADSASFSIDEILNPSGWVLLNYLMDARTGLGRFREFRVSNYHLMMQLIDYCAAHSIEQILALPDVKERADLYFAHRNPAQEQLRRCARVHGNLVVLDLRDEDLIFATNRFAIYAMFPDCNISIHVLWGLKRQNTAFAIGKSIVNRSSTTDVGSLCLKYGGGGHANAGTCQVEVAATDRVLAELIAAIVADG